MKKLDKMPEDADTGEQQQNNTQTQRRTPDQDQGTAKHPSEADTMDDMFPDGQNVIEGQLPGVIPAEGQEGEQQEQAESESDTTPEGDTPSEDTSTAEAENEGQDDGVEQAGDVNTSATVERVRKEAALDVEDEDELVDTVNRMQQDLRGTQGLRQIHEEVPELGQLVTTLLQNAQGEEGIDTADFYMTLDEAVPGVQVQAPDKNEDPDGYTDFQMRIKERRQKIQEQQQKRQKMQRIQNQIEQDYEQAFESFKKRKGLDDDEAQEYKQWFQQTFYGDYENGRLPRKDVFDLAWEHYADEDTPVEETDAYKEGYNAAIEEMKEGGASGDDTPNMMSSAGGGDDSPPESGTSEADKVMETLYSEEELNQTETIHDRF